MKKRTFWAAIALTMMATAALTGCSKEDEDKNLNGYYIPSADSSPTITTKDMTLTRSELDMVNRSNEFAFNLFRMAQDGSNSQILSPISIIYALGMLNNGAAGETQAQINKVYGCWSRVPADQHLQPLRRAGCRLLLPQWQHHADLLSRPSPQPEPQFRPAHQLEIDVILVTTVIPNSPTRRQSLAAGCDGTRVP